MGGTPDSKQIPFISWNTTCLPRKHRGFSLKNLIAWNKACITKLVWAVAAKKDILWVKWVHGMYLKNVDWWGYRSSPYCSWYWKKLVKIKDLLKGDSDQHRNWQVGRYTVSQGYKWLLGTTKHKAWSKFVWSRSIIPRHSFTSWAFYHQRLLVKSRLAKFTQCYEEKYCKTCPRAEDLEHVFFKCGWAQAFWQELTNWWPIPISPQGSTSFTNSMKKIPRPRTT